MQEPIQIITMGKKFNVTPMLDFNLSDIWFLPLSEKLQVLWNNNLDNGWGNYGWQIADEWGNELYTGSDNNKAEKIIILNR